MEPRGPLGLDPGAAEQPPVSWHFSPDLQGLFSLDSQAGKGRFAIDFKPAFLFKARWKFILKNGICFPGAEPGSCLIRILNLDLFPSERERERGRWRKKL